MKITLNLVRDSGSDHTQSYDTLTLEAESLGSQKLILTLGDPERQFTVRAFDLLQAVNLLYGRSNREILGEVK